MPLIAIVYCFLFMVSVVLMSQAALYIFERFLAKNYKSTSNDFAGLIFGAVSVIFSLIIAFVIVAVWNNYEDLNQTIEKEANKINNIITHAAALPDSLNIPICNALGTYCTTVVNEWNYQDKNEIYQPSAIPSLRMIILQIEPEGRMQENVMSIIDSDLNDISDLHRERLSHVRSHVPVLIWLILLIGSVLNIVFSFFIHTESVRLKRVGISFLSSAMALSIFLVYALDRPFAGNIHIGNEPYKKIAILLKQKSVMPIGILVP